MGLHVTPVFARGDARRSRGHIEGMGDAGITDTHFNLITNRMPNDREDGNILSEDHHFL